MKFVNGFSKSVCAVVFFCWLANTVAPAKAEAPAITYRNPIIPGALNTAPGDQLPQSTPPPVGDGNQWQPVTPGMSGDPTLLPWIPNVPANEINRSDSRVLFPTNSGIGPEMRTAPGELRAVLAPYIPAPPSTPGSDPGILPPINGYPQAAAVVGINPSAPPTMPGDSAPRVRRYGQPTADFGLARTNGSQLVDFGQKLSTKTDLANQPQFSQDGPRPLLPAQIGKPDRMSVTPSSWASGVVPQTTTDLHGNRILFKNVPARMTIAPY